MVTNTNKLSIELQVLLESVCFVLETDTTKEQADLWRKKVSDGDFKKLLALANHHGLVPCLAYSLESRCESTDIALENGLGELRKLNQILRFNSEYQTKAAVVVSELLSEKRIPHVVFKGTALLNQFYPDFILSRPSDDLDLLVAPGSLADTISALKNIGYKTQEAGPATISTLTQFIAEHPNWYRRRDISLQRNEELKHQIDLHWRISDDFTFSAETHQMLEDWAEINTRYGVLRSLPQYKHFVYLSSHGYSDYFFRLRYLADVYLAMRHIDFNRKSVIEFARQCGVERHVEQSIQLANALFNLDHDFVPMSKYAKLVVQRLIDSDGFTPRIHPNSGRWTRTDKNRYVLRQIQNRSTKAYWFSPLLARTKLGASDLHEWSISSSPLALFYLTSLVKKLYRKITGKE